jgi:hypothetical protein
MTMGDIVKALADPEAMDRSTVLVVAVALVGLFSAIWKLFEKRQERERVEIWLIVACFTVTLMLVWYETYFSRRIWWFYIAAAALGAAGSFFLVAGTDFRRAQDRKKPRTGSLFGRALTTGPFRLTPKEYRKPNLVICAVVVGTCALVAFFFRRDDKITIMITRVSDEEQILFPIRQRLTNLPDCMDIRIIYRDVDILERDSALGRVGRARADAIIYGKIANQWGALEFLDSSGAIGTGFNEYRGPETRYHDRFPQRVELSVQLAAATVDFREGRYDDGIKKLQCLAQCFDCDDVQELRTVKDQMLVMEALELAYAGYHHMCRCDSSATIQVAIARMEHPEILAKIDAPGLVFLGGLKRQLHVSRAKESRAFPADDPPSDLLIESKSLLNQALGKAPGYSRAHAELGDVYGLPGSENDWCNAAREYDLYLVWLQALPFSEPDSIRENNAKVAKSACLDSSK